MERSRYSIVKEGIKIEKGNSMLDVPFVLDATTIGRLEDPQERAQKSRRYLELVKESGIEDEFFDLNSNNLSVLLGLDHRAYGVLDMKARIPALSSLDNDLILSQKGSFAMCQMARNLNIYPEDQINGMVYAHVSSGSGITLETNPAGSSSLDTDGYNYFAERNAGERVTLDAHNLYTYEMQIICLSGLVAISNCVKSNR